MITPQTHTDYIFGFYQSWLCVALVVNLAIILYLVTIVNVGRARVRYKIMPPATTGHPDFERYYRVQQNTLEQIVPFVPSLLMFAGFWQAPKLAAALGFAWLIGRTLYMIGYYKAVSKRTVGFIISQLTTVILSVGACAGILRAFF
jgi:glutathione S-transferase